MEESTLEQYNNFVKQQNKLIKNMKEKAKAFDEIDDLIVNGALKDRGPDIIFHNICHVIIDYKERGSDE